MFLKNKVWGKKKKSKNRRKSTYRCSKFTTQTTNGNKHIQMLVLFSRASWFYTGLYGCIYGVFSQDSDLHFNEVNLDLPG